jgi:hypothetical protein
MGAPDVEIDEQELRDEMDEFLDMLLNAKANVSETTQRYSGRAYLFRMVAHTICLTTMILMLLSGVWNSPKDTVGGAAQSVGLFLLALILSVIFLNPQMTRE